MNESRSRYAASDPGLTCDTLLKQAEQLSRQLTEHRTTADTALKYIHSKLEQIAEYIEIILKIRTISQHTSYRQHYQDAAERGITFANNLLIEIFDTCLKRNSCHTLEALSQIEQLYLRITSLLKQIAGNHAMVMVDLCIMYHQFLSNYPQFQTREHITQLYQYIYDNIQTYSTNNPPPKALPVTDIFEMYARVLHNESPLLARDVLLSALDYSNNGYCHDKSALYLCLKGLAANYIKLVDRRYGYINDENSDQEIDACYQLAIHYSKRAIDFQRINELKGAENQNCFTMLSVAFVRLAKHYEYLYHKLRNPGLLLQIEHWYLGAIHWAHEAGDKRKAGIAHYHLTCHFLRQNRIADAFECWQKAVDNLIQDLEAQPIAPLRLTTMKSHHRQLLLNSQPVNDEYISHCLQLVKDLIDLGNTLKNQATQRFYRFAQQTNPLVSTAPHLHLPKNASTLGTRR